MNGREASETGAYVQPQLPTTSVVTPWRIVLCAVGLVRIVKSLWLCGSTKPGQTTRPPASITRSARVAVDVADRGDPPVLDRDVAAERRRAGAVDDQRVADDQVGHLDDRLRVAVLDGRRRWRRRRRGAGRGCRAARRRGS